MQHESFFFNTSSSGCFVNSNLTGWTEYPRHCQSCSGKSTGCRTRFLFPSRRSRCWKAWRDEERGQSWEKIWVEPCWTSIGTGTKKNARKHEKESGCPRTSLLDGNKCEHYKTSGAQSADSFTVSCATNRLKPPPAVPFVQVSLESCTQVDFTKKLQTENDHG